MTEGSPRQSDGRGIALVEEGLAQARSIPHPLMRARHLYSWAYRLSAVDPAAAASLLGDLPDEPDARLDLLLAVLSDLAARGDSLEPVFSHALNLSRQVGPHARVRALNTLSEAGIRVAETDRDAAAAALGRLAPEAAALADEAGDVAQDAALACALVGEALLAVDVPAALGLLEQAEALCEELPGRDPVLAFLAGALIEHKPEWAEAIGGAVQDPGVRLEARLQLAEKTGDAALRERLLDAAEEDAAQIEHFRGPEALVRVGLGIGPMDPARARTFFQRALDGAAESAPQVKSLQWTGVASAAAETDREWARQIFRDAVEAAMEEPEAVRRVVSLAVIADEMSVSHPQEAVGVFARAVRESEALDALWEHAHVLDVMFRPDRSPYLDVRPAAPLVERVLSRLTGEDPRIPGVFGLPEAARLMLQVDPSRAAEPLRRWYRAAAESGDTDGMTQAALALREADPAAGREALESARDLLRSRIDCPAMGEFSRLAAPVAPDLVLDLAPLIPDRRERVDATTAAAISLFEREPEQALALIRGLERPVDRSTAFMRLADGILGTGDRPEPQPLLEELP